MVRNENKNTIIILILIVLAFLAFKGELPFLGSAEPLRCAVDTACSIGFSCKQSENVSSSNLTGTCTATTALSCISSGGSWLAYRGINATNLTFSDLCRCPSDSTLQGTSCEKISQESYCTTTKGTWENTTSTCICPDNLDFKTNIGCEFSCPDIALPTCVGTIIKDDNGCAVSKTCQTEETNIIYYRFENNACSQQQLAPSSATANDYSSLTECENKIITTPPTGSGSGTTIQPPPIQSGKSTTTSLIIAAALVAFIIWRKKFQNATKK